MNQPKIACTAIIITLNEEATIGRVLDSVDRFEQRLVIDSGSTDNTIKIAMERGAEVISFQWNGQYPKKKEWSQFHPRVRNDWTLLLDADEYLSIDLANELESHILAGSASALDVSLSYYWAGKELRHGHRARKRICLRTSRTSWPKADDLAVLNMWEVEGHYQPRVNGTVVQCAHRLIHEDDGLLYDYFARHNRYSDWEAQLRKSSSAAVSGARMRRANFWIHVPFKPFIFFIYSFGLRAGFLDGLAGFDFALAQAFYYWQISAKSREIRWRVRNTTAGQT